MTGTRQNYDAYLRPLLVLNETSRDRPESAPRASFFNMRRTLFSNFYQIFSAKIPEGNFRKPRFHYWKHKIFENYSFIDFFYRKHQKSIETFMASRTILANSGLSKRTKAMSCSFLKNRRLKMRLLIVFQSVWSDHYETHPGKMDSSHAA